MTVLQDPAPRYACCQHCNEGPECSYEDTHGWPCARCGNQKPVPRPGDTFSLAGWPTLLDREDAYELWSALNAFIHTPSKEST